MKVLNILFIIFFTGIYSSSMAQNVEIAGQIIEDSEKGVVRPEVLDEFYMELENQVYTEIENEATAAGLSLAEYLKSDKSFIAFVESFKAYDIETMKKPALLVLIIKTGLRFGLQKSIRVFPDGHFDRVQQTNEFSKKIAEKLGVELKL